MTESETETDLRSDEPIRGTVERWHAFMRGESSGGLDDLLHDDCVFLSPIVFTPQKGKALTMMYLQAAGATFTAGASSDDAGGGDSEAGASAKSGAGRSFRYVKEVLTGHHAVLEFETEMGGKYVNGVDILTCDDDGRITEFKVMIRPLQAVNLMHEAMRSMLEKMGPPPES